MADDTQDIFGKIDAILGKRAGFASGQPAREEEFPLLTEIVSDAEIARIQPPSPGATAAGRRQALAPVPTESIAGEDRVPPPTPALSSADLDRLAAALEARLADLFIRQQLRIEALVRRVVREELEKHSRPEDRAAPPL